MKAKVLYVDDEIHNLNSFKATFRREFDILLASSAAEALELLKENQIHVIITDHKMPEVSGVELLGICIKEFPDLFRILITGCSDVKIVIDAINQGQVYRFLTKPWDKDELVSTVEGALILFEKNDNSNDLNESLDETNRQLEFMLRQKLIS